jgi:hypothetical protein
VIDKIHSLKTDAKYNKLKSSFEEETPVEKFSEDVDYQFRKTSLKIDYAKLEMLRKLVKLRQTFGGYEDD